MALNATTLSSAIRSALLAADAGWLDNAALTATCDAIAGAVVAHITANAVVNVTSVSGVTTGGGVSGPGVGTVS